MHRFGIADKQIPFLFASTNSRLVRTIFKPCCALSHSRSLVARPACARFRAQKQLGCRGAGPGRAVRLSRRDFGRDEGLIFGSNKGLFKKVAFLVGRPFFRSSPAISWHCRAQTPSTVASATCEAVDGGEHGSISVLPASA